MRAIAFIAFGVGSSACDLKNAYFIKDSEGTSYRVSCVRNRCDTVVETPFAATPGITCESGEKAAVVLTARKVLTVCHACVGATNSHLDARQCRSITCNVAQDCAPYRGSDPVECIRGLCQIRREESLDTTAATALCMIGAGPIEKGRGNRVRSEQHLRRSPVGLMVFAKHHKVAGSRECDVNTVVKRVEPERAETLDANCRGRRAHARITKRCVQRVVRGRTLIPLLSFGGRFFERDDLRSNGPSAGVRVVATPSIQPGTRAMTIFAMVNILRLAGGAWTERLRSLRIRSWTESPEVQTRRHIPEPPTLDDLFAALEQRRQRSVG